MNTDDRALADLIAELRDGVSSQSHDMCGYEKKDDTIIRLRRQRRELAKVATTAIDRLEAFHAKPDVEESAAQRVVAAWRAVNTEFGSYFVDEDGPYREIRDMDEAVEVLSTPVAAQGDVREALEELEVTERNYRLQHDLHGGDDMRTGKAWDQMRRAGDRARKLLATLKDSSHEG